MAYRLDVESFISEVKKHPEIWDLTSEDNRYKNKKQRAWSQIARLFIEEFDGMGGVEKEDVLRKLQSKWRNIRDSFVRYAKKPDAKRGYMYAKNLSFLNTIYKITSGNEVEAENDSNSNHQWESDDDQVIKSKRKRHIVLNDNSNFSDEEPPSTIDNFKRKHFPNVKMEALEFVDTPPPITDNFPMEDEDRSFFESLLPAVRQFNMDQKLEFRSEVLNLVKNIRTTSRIKSIEIEAIITN